MTSTFNISAELSFGISLLSLLIGYGCNKKIRFFAKHHIPEPVVGGLIIATIIALLRSFDVYIDFNLPLQEAFMLMFFASVGLSANFSQIKRGGTKLGLFLGIASVFIVLQNLLGVSLAGVLGIDPLFGLVAGSITLTGGHGTGAAWAETLQANFGLVNVMEISMASATFGLVLGGLIGSPIAKALITRYQLSPTDLALPVSNQAATNVLTYDPSEVEHISAKSLLKTLFSLVVCMVLAQITGDWVKQLDIHWLTVPSFVYALFFGVLINNLLSLLKAKPQDNQSLDILGSLSLTLFLAMALLNLKLWNVLDLAIPILLILVAQTLLQVAFAYFVTFKTMGADYDAAVMASGHCGFGMGSTATAVMNMHSVTDKLGPSPQSFVILPIVGAFFIDLVNLIILQAMVLFIG